MDELDKKIAVISSGINPKGKDYKLKKILIGNDVWLGRNVLITKWFEYRKWSYCTGQVQLSLRKRCFQIMPQLWGFRLALLDTDMKTDEILALK